MRDPNLFSIPAGAPFLPTLSRALLDGELTPGFPGDGGPMALARATIYVPTRRAARELSLALLEASGGGGLLLPRIAPLGAFEATQDELLFEEPQESFAPPPPAVPELTRRMVLARLTQAWGEALRGAIAGVDGDGRLLFHEREAPLVAASPAQAFALAGDLAGLIDDMIIEGAPWTRLDRLAPGDYDSYWAITLDFLKIAIARWPAWLEENGFIDRATRGALLVDQEIARLEAGGFDGPLVIAGSTGTISATARLIGAIARAPLGAVVLPDLDLTLDDAAWAMIGAEDGALIAGHPQAALFRLLRAIGVERAAVRELGPVAAPLRRRAAFLSEALRPADSTERWRLRNEALAEPNVHEALADVAVIEASDENEEALALAIAMRAALETPGKTAALISPEPDITRRVKAELARWNIEIDDSAGESLGRTPAGAFARLALAAAFDRRALDLIALLAHPLARLSRRRDEIVAAARTLEIGALRGVLPATGLDDLDSLFGAARQAALDRHAHPARSRWSPAQWRAAESLLRDVLAALAPLRALPAKAPLAEFVAAHRAALAALSATHDGDDLAAAPGGEALLALLDEWAQAAREAFACEASDYAALFAAAAAERRAPDASKAHQRLHMLGLLESRLLSFDLVLLAGLDEAVWPPQARTDAFLNRPMRAALGLSAPERRIGQTAHDFVATLGAREAIVSRARKRGGAPTVASRLIQRIGAVAGAAAYGEACARGETYLRLARAIDRPSAYHPVEPPTPKPPVALRPRGLSVTRIETLRRDPYAIYAERILKLAPLEPIGAVWGPREIGDQWHWALSDFAGALARGELDRLAEGARARLIEIARQRFAPMLADPVFRALHWPRVAQGLDFYLEFERGRRGKFDRLLVEEGGALEIDLAEGPPFRLTARADRIELTGEGGAMLVDYKSGAPPSVREVQVGFAPQLTLEAAMLDRGGFAAAKGARALGGLYVKLGGGKGGEIRELNFKDEAFGAVVERHYRELVRLLEQFASADTPYLSRPIAKYAGRFGDYDHLARVQEWSATAGQSDEAGAPE